MAQLESERLVLKTIQTGDAKDVAAALNDFDISKNLATVPHPYGENDAYGFIGRVAEEMAKGEAHVFIIRRKGDGALVGCCGLHLKNGVYEIGYWIAKPFWRQGFAGEAAHRLVRFAFDDLGMGELTAGWYHDNGISARVLAKLGFKAVRVEKQFSQARGHNVLCNRCMLTQADFERKKPSEAQSGHHGVSLEPAA